MIRDAARLSERPVKPFEFVHKPLSILGGFRYLGLLGQRSASRTASDGLPAEAAARQERTTVIMRTTNGFIAAPS